MKKKKIFQYPVFYLTVLFLMIPGLCSAADYELLDSGFPIANTPLHEQGQWNTYNSVSNNYMVIMRTTGPKYGNCTDPDDIECNDCFYGIETIRVSPDGEVLGKTTVSPLEGSQDNCSWKMMPRVAHNPFRDEYLMLYLKAPYVCSSCHDGTPDVGTVQPSDCAKCHPLGNAGECNLIDAHENTDTNCLTCHTECVGGDSPAAGSSSHIDDCMACHDDDIHSWVHGYSLGSEMYTCRVDSSGNLLTQPKRLHPTVAVAAHPSMAFNTTRREYGLVYNDRGVFGWRHNNVGFILDEDGNIIRGPSRWDTGDGHHFAYDLQYNPDNDTYLLNWEDFRHSGPPYWFWPNDIYGGIVNGEGDMIVDFAVIEDCGDPDVGDQWWPAWAYNSDKKEWLITWVDKRASLEEATGIMGRFLDAEGNFKTEEFLIIDGHKTENQQALVYVPKEKKYFMVWMDSRDYEIDPEVPWLAENNIYGAWLDDSGLPVGDEIPICVEDGDQSVPRLNYNPLMNQFFISWWDTNCPLDFEEMDCENSMWAGPVEEGGTRGHQGCNLRHTTFPHYTCC
ncbi:MAG: hypothetical protein JRI87_09885 [Deltaproteobacteria bacterium]|nr:hypothetical protein [Deltaproteobacteria bacterium]